MAIDIVSLVSQYLTPQVIGQIAKTTGVDPAAAQKLVSGATPAILASLASAAAAPGGAQKISDLVSNADSDLLKNLSGALSGGQSQMLTDGANALSGVLGGSNFASLVGGLSQFAGVPQAAAQSAIGAVAHAVVGVMGDQDPSNWSDAASIGNLLSSQKSAIAAALPSGLSSVLSASGLLAGVGAAAGKIGGAAAGMASGAASSAASSASNVASSASNMASSAMNRASSAAPSSSGFPMWAIIVVVILVLAAIYWFVESRKSEKPASSMIAPTIELALAGALADAS